VVAVASFGWQPLAVGRLLIVGDSDFNRRRVHEHAALFAAALPERGAAVRRWLAGPSGPSEPLAGLLFFANRHPGTTNARFATVRRVRGRSGRRPATAASSTEHESRATVPRQRR
jgi:hypothetical protein